MYCKNCGKPITSIATECPYCHVKVIENTPISNNNSIYNNPSPYMKYNNQNTYNNNQKILSIGDWIATICIIIGIIMLIKSGFDFAEWDNNYYGMNPDERYGTSSSTTYKPIPVPKNSLELVENVSMTSSGGLGYYTYYIEGILKNVSGKRLDYAQVSFVIYDMAGNNIGSAFDNVNYIDVNGTWKFKAMYFGEESKIKYDPVPQITSW